MAKGEELKTKEYVLKMAKAIGEVIEEDNKRLLEGLWVLQKGSE